MYTEDKVAPTHKQIALLECTKFIWSMAFTPATT